MKFWNRPWGRLLALFFLLGLFAWWTFQVVSLPPSLRDLFEEDGAIAAAAAPISAEEQWAEALARLPAPPQQHAPEVTALIGRLQSLPPLPYLLANALARDAAVRPGQTPPPWTEEEETSLRATQLSYLQAWDPFFQAPAPDWPNFPDSVLLFRSKLLLLSLREEILSLLGYRPGEKNGIPPAFKPLERPELMLPLLRQCRHLGSLRLGQREWEISDTIGAAALAARCLETFVTGWNDDGSFLATLRQGAAPAPSLLDLRTGLEADRSFFLRAADYLASLPPSTPADLALFRFLQDREDTEWYLRQSNDPETAGQLAALLRRDAEQLEILRQKTFLTGPAWRQWLSEDPGRGLSPLLATGLGGFREFEDVRMDYRVAQASLEARMAWERGGLSAALRIPDPASPGSFLRVEETSAGIRISSAYIPPGDATQVSFLVPMEPMERR